MLRLKYKLMENLFENEQRLNSPLPARLRPKSWNEFVGHEQLCLQLQKMPLHSMILYGPPGCGKTTLAKILADGSGNKFYFLSAVSCGVKEIREVIAQGREELLNQKKSIVLFLDEIHRFSKSQQDSLLEAVECGWVILIGATTQNPAFEVISPLLSRCRIYQLKALTDHNLKTIFENAIMDSAQPGKVSFEDAARDILIEASAGDARKLLGCVEASQLLADENQVVNKKTAQKILEGQMRNYDKAGDNHYDYISAFIKSLRGSDPDAALLYLAVMLESGEDPVFIARRMVIFSSEDIGNASPQALSLAMSAYLAAERIGMPESRIILSQAAVFLASSPKSNACYLGINKAMGIVKNKSISIPDHLRNAPTSIHKAEGAAKDYQYPHDHHAGFIRKNYFPQGYENSSFYTPTDQGQESRIAERLKNLWPDRFKD